MNILTSTLSAFLVLASITSSGAQNPEKVKVPNYSSRIQKEQLGRGLTAIHHGSGKVSVSWRYLDKDPIDIAFDLYRRTDDGEAVRLNDKPITQSTFFTDMQVDIRKDNTYLLKISTPAASEQPTEYALTAERARYPYLRIPMQQVPGDSDWRYAPNDASVGDLDGDGEYELVIKRENKGFDNSHSGLCNGGPILEAYKMDGRMLWRVDLGENIRQGAHYTQLMVYDFDGDGKAEVAVKTAEGTRFGDGMVIGDTDGDGITDYVDRNPDSPTYGKILQGPEFLSVIEGTTGRELARTSYISRGEPNEFGDRKGNRVDRFLGGAGYFDGRRPSILICRGYYAKTVLEAWDFRNGKLTRRWRFSTTDDGGKYKSYEGQGNHNLRIGDVDGDGKDEVTYGACLIDHDGTGGYNTRLGHGDAIHLTDIDIDRPGLEVWDCHEHVPSRAGSELRDARTGALIWGIPAIEDVGRAMTADIDPRFRGCEVWSSATGGIYTADGRLITDKRAPVNMAVWWTGDLNRELLDGARSQGWTDRNVRLCKWNGDGLDEIPLPGQEEVILNNGTKSNPCMQADLLGDWREEIVVRTKDNREVRIYMTDYPTDYRFHTLMNDPIYRWSVLTENIAYNQPTQPGFYLGSDLGKFWPGGYTSSGKNSKSGKTEDGRPNDMNQRLRGGKEVIHRDIKTNASTYTLDARYDYDTYKWTVNGREVKAGRQLKLDAKKHGKHVTVTLEAIYKGCVFKDRCSVRFE